MTQASLAYVGLGSNLGDREATLRRALRELDASDRIRVRRASGLNASVPLGGMDQPAYVNGVVALETSLTATALWRRLQEIETRLGRIRGPRWGARTVDLDLLLFDAEVIATPELLVPHPQLLWRHFVLEPLAELDPQLRIPGLGTPVAVLAERLAGRSFVPPGDAPRLLAVAGNIGAGKTTLAERLAAALGGCVCHEPYDTNPFLASVYAGHQDLALDSQLYFLVSRAEQLAPAALPPGRVTVTDYLFAQDRVYAEVLLQGEQRALHGRLYPFLAAGPVPPTLVLYLQASIETCLERIRRRGRPYEQAIAPDFLAGLEGGYARLLAAWDTCPLLRLDGASFDARDTDQIAALAGEVTAYLHAADGTWHRRLLEDEARGGC